MVGNKKKIIQYLLDQKDDKQFDIKEFKETKTDKQRKYCWAIINEIGNVVRKSKEEVYIDFLKHYSQSDYISVREEVKIEDYFEYYKKVGSGKVKGKTFNHYLVFVGMSKMSKKDMMIFIDGVCHEAENVGVETLETIALKSMIENHNKK